MAEHTIQNWIKVAVKQMKFPPDRDKVRQELWDHLLDSRDCRVEQGMGLKEAEEAAVKAMGDPVETGKLLNKVHRPWLGWLWRASQLLLLTAVLVSFRMACTDPRFSVYNFRLGLYDQPDWFGCQESCAYPPFVYWTDPPEVERTPIQPGAVEQAGVYELTLDHGSWVTAEDQQWVVLCFRVRAERLLDMGPSGFAHFLLAEDDLGTQFRDVHLGTSSAGGQVPGFCPPYLHLMLTIPDGEPRQWARLYVPGTEFDITIDREGRVLPWPRQED